MEWMICPSAGHYKRERNERKAVRVEIDLFIFYISTSLPPWTKGGMLKGVDVATSEG
jgi:hypothetical protein